MTTITVQYLTVTHPVTGQRIKGHFILENGRPTGFYAYTDRSEAVKQAKALATIRTGRYVDVGIMGWPLVPSKRFSGETALSCPKCHSTNVTLFSVQAGLGSGYGGTFRLGDNYQQAVRCEDCKYQTIDKTVEVMA